MSQGIVNTYMGFNNYTVLITAYVCGQIRFCKLLYVCVYSLVSTPLKKLWKVAINISGKLSYNTIPYAYSLIWGKKKASLGFHWGMENLSDDNEQIIDYSSSITAPLHPGMPGNVI